MIDQKKLEDDEHGFYRDTLVLSRYHDGGHISVLEQPPEDSAAYRIKESHSEVGKPDVDYPRERDHCTFTRYAKVHRRRRSVSSDYKVIEVAISRASHADEADRIEAVLDRVKQLPDLRERLDACDSYAAYREQADVLRQHDRLYQTVQTIWFKDSLKSYATENNRCQEFEIEQYPHGFYKVPRLYHQKANKVIGDELYERGIGKYSVCWSGYIVEPADFTAVHEFLKPFYHTAGDTA